MAGEEGFEWPNPNFLKPKVSNNSNICRFRVHFVQPIFSIYCACRRSWRQCHVVVSTNRKYRKSGCILQNNHPEKAAPDGFWRHFLVMNIHFIRLQGLFCGVFLASKQGLKHCFSGSVPPSRERGKNTALSSKNAFFWELTFCCGQHGTSIGGLSALRWRSRPSRPCRSSTPNST